MSGKLAASTSSPALNRAEPGSFLPRRTILIALYLFYVAQLGRTVAWFSVEDRPQEMAPWVIGLELIFLMLFSLMIWRSNTANWIFHLYLTFQSALIVSMVFLVPRQDFLPGLLILLSYQAALKFRGKIRSAWIVTFILLNPVPLVLLYDPLRNLALSLPNMAGCLVLAAYIAATLEDERIRAQTLAILAELEETNRQLQAYAGQVEELAAIEERNRLARELHDSVSQTVFSILLNVRSTQLLIERDPARLPEQLDTLHKLAQSALAEMRGLIAQLRPKTE
jgi:signal transduction histidine kinase